MSGWIKLHRSLKEWEWYEDSSCVLLLVHLLVSVNFERKKWKGIIIERGTGIFSWESLSKGSKLSIQQCKTAVKKLERSGEISRKATNKYQAITLLKWDNLQSENKTATNKQQTNNKQTTTTKERKEYKERKEVNNNIVFSQEVLQTFEESLKYFPDSLKPKNEKIKINWLKTIEQLNRIDEVPFELINQIVKKTREDDFWSSNFLSIPKLRKKNKDGVSYYMVFFEKFIKINNNGTNQRFNQKGATKDELADVLKRHFDAQKNGESF